MEYKNVESLVMPLEIDLSSSPDGIYVRRNIKRVETDDGYKYTYQESFMSQDEYESYQRELLVNKFNGEDNTPEYQAFKERLDTGTPYINGKNYKPKWYKLYAEIISDLKDALDLYERVGGDITPTLNKTINIYDETGAVENATPMTIKEILDLYFFLYFKKDEFYNDFKQSLNA